MPLCDNQENNFFVRPSKTGEETWPTKVKEICKRQKQEALLSTYIQTTMSSMPGAHL